MSCDGNCGKYEQAAAALNGDAVDDKSVAGELREQAVSHLMSHTRASEVRAASPEQIIAAAQMCAADTGITTGDGDSVIATIAALINKPTPENIIAYLDGDFFYDDRRTKNGILAKLITKNPDFGAGVAGVMKDGTSNEQAMLSEALQQRYQGGLSWEDIVATHDAGIVEAALMNSIFDNQQSPLPAAHVREVWDILDSGSLGHAEQILLQGRLLTQYGGERAEWMQDAAANLLMSHPFSMGRYRREGDALLNYLLFCPGGHERVMNARYNEHCLQYAAGYNEAQDPEASMTRQYARGFLAAEVPAFDKVSDDAALTVSAMWQDVPSAQQIVLAEQVKAQLPPAGERSWQQATLCALAQRSLGEEAELTDTQISRMLERDEPCVWTVLRDKKMSDLAGRNIRVSHQALRSLARGRVSRPEQRLRGIWYKQATSMLSGMERNRGMGLLAALHDIEQKTTTLPQDIGDPALWADTYIRTAVEQGHPDRVDALLTACPPSLAYPVSQELGPIFQSHNKSGGISADTANELAQRDMTPENLSLFIAAAQHAPPYSVGEQAQGVLRQLYTHGQVFEEALVAMKRQVPELIDRVQLSDDELLNLAPHHPDAEKMRGVVTTRAMQSPHMIMRVNLLRSINS